MRLLQYFGDLHFITQFYSKRIFFTELRVCVSRLACKPTFGANYWLLIFTCHRDGEVDKMPHPIASEVVCIRCRSWLRSQSSQYLRTDDPPGTTVIILSAVDPQVWRCAVWISRGAIARVTNNTGVHEDHVKKNVNIRTIWAGEMGRAKMETVVTTI